MLLTLPGVGPHAPPLSTTFTVRCDDLFTRCRNRVVISHYGTVPCQCQIPAAYPTTALLVLYLRPAGYGLPGHPTGLPPDAFAHFAAGSPARRYRFTGRGLPPCGSPRRSGRSQTVGSPRTWPTRTVWDARFLYLSTPHPTTPPDCASLYRTLLRPCPGLRRTGLRRFCPSSDI